MDYIREELLRQRTAMARLLLGQGGDDPEERELPATAESEEMLSQQLAGAEVFWASRKLAAGERFSRPVIAARTADAEIWGAYSGLAEELPEAALRREAGGERTWLAPIPLSAGMEETTAYRQMKSDLDRDRRGGNVLSSFSGEEVPVERTVTETVWASPAESSGAEELSRVFQRDARRYDGGFTLY